MEDFIEELRFKALAQLKECQEGGDDECAHINADIVLAHLLSELVFEDVVQECAKVHRQYAKVEA